MNRLWVCMQKRYSSSQRLFFVANSMLILLSCIGAVMLNLHVTFGRCYRDFSSHSGVFLLADTPTGDVIHVLIVGCL